MVFLPVGKPKCTVGKNFRYNPGTSYKLTIKRYEVSNYDNSYLFGRNFVQ